MDINTVKQMEMKELLMWKTTNMQVDLATKKYRLECANERKYQWWGQRDVTMDMVEDIPDNTETKEERIERAKLKTIQWWASRDVTMEMASELRDTPMTTPTTKPDEMFARMIRKRNRKGKPKYRIITIEVRDETITPAVVVDKNEMMLL